MTITIQIMGNQWSQDQEIRLSFAEYADIRARTAEIWPTLDDGKMLGATASNVGMILAVRLGMIDPGQWDEFRAIAKRWMPWNPFASPSFIRVLICRVRVVAVDGVTLKRRKHFPALPGLPGTVAATA